MTTHGRAGTIAYWTLVVVLIAFGVLGLLSIGFPFLVLGITLAILSDRRHETGVIATAVSAILGFVVGYLLVAPVKCTFGADAVDGIDHHTCSSVLGFDYSGGGDYNPSLLPGLLAGLVVAVLFGLGARWLARRLAARRTPPVLA